MRIDSPNSVNSWLKGQFEGRFKGYLEGTAEHAKWADRAYYALTASTVQTAGFVSSLENALDDPQYQDVFDKLRSQGRLIVSGGIKVASGDVEIESGSLRIKKVILEYLDNEDALNFRFVGTPGPEPGPTPPPPPPYPPYPPFPPPWPPCPPPWPPFPPCPPPPPPPEPPVPPTGSTSGSTFSHSIDFAREGRY